MMPAVTGTSFDTFSKSLNLKLYSILLSQSQLSKKLDFINAEIMELKTRSSSRASKIASLEQDSILQKAYFDELGKKYWTLKLKIDS